jgi:leucyl aminopeptidase
MLKNELDIRVSSEKLSSFATEGIVLGVFEGEGLKSPQALELDALFGGKITTLIERGEIRGELKEFHTLHELDGSVQRVIIIGCGKRGDFTNDTVRFLAAKGARTARKLGQTQVSILLQPMEEKTYAGLGLLCSEGLIMGLDRFEVYKTKKRKGDRDNLKEVIFLAPSELSATESELGAKRGIILGQGNVLARSIANHPGNKMTPTILAENAKKVAEDGGLGFSVMDEPELIEKGFEGITAVSAGSVENCKLIKLTYRGQPDSDKIHIGLVGKGLTFDAGGISIKPSANMHLMKYDMCGGAAVLGAASIIARLKPALNVNFYIPSSENLLGAKAYKPGDILKMYGGHTVEITNTDAEGRLLLADAIAFAVEEKAEKIITTATLTGAVVGALGHLRTGLLSRNESLKELVREAADECDEKVWELPLDKEYKVTLRSNIADIANAGNRLAGSSTAGIFLNEFAGDVPFCHLDIAGTAWVENLPTQYNFKPYLPKDGASGTAARTLGLVVEKLSNA